MESEENNETEIENFHFIKLVNYQRDLAYLSMDINSGHYSHLNKSSALERFNDINQKHLISWNAANTFLEEKPLIKTIRKKSIVDLKNEIVELKADIMKRIEDIK